MPLNNSQDDTPPSHLPCNVHSVVTATQDAEFGRVVREADMATPDDAPVEWMMRKLGHADQQRINGPDLMWRSKSAEV